MYRVFRTSGLWRLFQIKGLLTDLSRLRYFTSIVAIGYPPNSTQSASFLSSNYYSSSQRKANPPISSVQRNKLVRAQCFDWTSRTTRFQELVQASRCRSLGFLWECVEAPTARRAYGLWRRAVLPSCLGSTASASKSGKKQQTFSTKSPQACFPTLIIL